MAASGSASGAAAAGSSAASLAPFLPLAFLLFLAGGSSAAA